MIITDAQRKLIGRILLRVAHQVLNEFDASTCIISIRLYRISPINWVDTAAHCVLYAVP